MTTHPSKPLFSKHLMRTTLGALALALLAGCASKGQPRDANP